MNNTDISLYRLAIRLRQAHLTYKWVQGVGTSYFAVEDVSLVKNALGRLQVALGHCLNQLTTGDTGQTCQSAVRKALRECDDLFEERKAEHSLEFSSVTTELTLVETVLRQLVSIQEAQFPRHKAWFELGLEIVNGTVVSPPAQLPEPWTSNTQRSSTGSRKTPRPRRPEPSGPARYEFKHPRRVDNLLDQLDLKREILIRELPPAEDPLHRELPVSWGSSDTMLGWYYIEAGLKSLISASGAVGGKRRRCYERDQQFLDWYQQEGTDTYHSPTTIAKRWKEANGDDVSVDTVKTGLRKARKERPK